MAVAFRTKSNKGTYRKGKARPSTSGARGFQHPTPRPTSGWKERSNAACAVNATTHAEFRARDSDTAITQQHQARADLLMPFTCGCS
jgi:hypothetical protein